MTTASGMSPPEHRAEAAKLLDKSKAQAAEKRSTAAALSASWALVHAVLAQTSPWSGPIR